MHQDPMSSPDPAEEPKLDTLPETQPEDSQPVVDDGVVIATGPDGTGDGHGDEIADSDQPIGAARR